MDGKVCGLYETHHPGFLLIKDDNTPKGSLKIHEKRLRIKMNNGRIIA